MDIQLPADYIRYVESGKLLEGFTTGDPGYFQLWPLTDVQHLNKEYHVDEFAPGFLCFGSNGGGELLAFDLIGAVFMLPAVGMESKYAKRIGEKWRDVETRIKGATEHWIERPAPQRGDS